MVAASLFGAAVSLAERVDAAAAHGGGYARARRISVALGRAGGAHGPPRQGRGIGEGPCCRNRRGHSSPAERLERTERSERMIFAGFTRADIHTSGAAIIAVRGGAGPPLLLLHGYPQTHVMWHKVAPLLTRDFT